MKKLYDIITWVSIVFGFLLTLLGFAVALLGLATQPVHASEPLNVTNVHYTADNGLQTGNTFTLREGYRERIYYQIEYTGDGNPSDLMLMWNDYQGIEITVQQYTQGSGVMLVRYNESFSGWGVTGFWVQGGNGNGKRMLRFRSQPNTPPVTTLETTTEQPTTQPEAEEQTNEDTTGIENGLSEQPEQQQQQPIAGTNETTIISGHDGTQQQSGNPTTTDSGRGQTTSVSMEEKTQEKTVESTEKSQEAVSDVLTEKKEESTYTASKHGERKPKPKKKCWRQI